MECKRWCIPQNPCCILRTIDKPNAMGFAPAVGEGARDEDAPGCDDSCIVCDGDVGCDNLEACEVSSISMVSPGLAVKVGNVMVTGTVPVCAMAWVTNRNEMRNMR